MIISRTTQPDDWIIWYLVMRMSNVEIVRLNSQELFVLWQRLRWEGKSPVFVFGDWRETSG